MAICTLRPEALQDQHGGDDRQDRQQHVSGEHPSPANTPTRRPPRAGPAIPPVPTILRCSPRAFPRSEPGNAETIIAIPVPCVIAAPAPWITRGRTSTVIFAEEPASAAPIKKTTKPATYTCLRPTISDSRPMGRSSALVVRANAMTTHCDVGRSV